MTNVNKSTVNNSQFLFGVHILLHNNVEIDALCDEIPALARLGVNTITSRSLHTQNSKLIRSSPEIGRNLYIKSAVIGESN